MRGNLWHNGRLEEVVMAKDGKEKNEGSLRSRQGRRRAEGDQLPSQCIASHREPDNIHITHCMLNSFTRTVSSLSLQCVQCFDSAFHILLYGNIQLHNYY